MIEEKLNNGLIERIEQIDTKPINDSNLLTGVLGHSLLMSNKVYFETYNDVRWTTSATGVNTDSASLHATNPYVCQFENEEVIGDRAENDTTSGWAFWASVPGTYRLSANIRIDIDNSGAASTEELETYIQSLGELWLSFYRNDGVINPQPTLLDIGVWDRGNTATYYTYKLTANRFTYSNSISMIYYLDEGDKIDLRTNFTQYTPVNPITLIQTGDVNINLISKDKENYQRVIYV